MACDVDFGVQMKVHLYVFFHGFAPATHSSFWRLLELSPMPIGLERFDKAFRDVDRKSDAQLFDIDAYAQFAKYLNRSSDDTLKWTSDHFDWHSGL
jgi:hypothetical protein